MRTVFVRRVRGSRTSSITGSASTLKDLVAQVERGEGTLGKIWQDETLYEDIRGMVNQMEKVLEDYREQAPISTLWGAVFSAF